jgi:hypothetical protein
LYICDPRQFDSGPQLQWFAKMKSLSWLLIVPRAIGRLFAADLFHKWVGSLSAIAQAGAVIFGVWYAIQQFSEREEDKTERRMERVLEYVQKRNEDQAINESMWYFDSLRGTKGTEEVANFNRHISPVWKFFDQVGACVTNGLCDKHMAMDKFCPDVVTYLLAARKVEMGLDAGKPVASDEQILETMGPEGLETSKKIKKVMFAVLSTLGSPVGDFFMMCRADNPALGNYVFPEFEGMWVREPFKETPPELLNNGDTSDQAKD